MKKHNEYKKVLPRARLELDQASGTLSELTVYRASVC